MRYKKFSAQKTKSVPIVLSAERVQDKAVYQIFKVDVASSLFLKNEERAWTYVTFVLCKETFRISNI